ncbi:sugar ABC transporter permease [Streptomyces sp. FR-008]|uniref:sugar ABC transporter permease n=1 Tax=Streptomyces sp. FR-008 TaxID=206662 RepID=UPI000722AD21|nr:ABC transporter permease [Streptomyces sp. FR-008]ALM37689.1 ABC transporter permease [Streptomyces sp. FR-008]KAF0790791.1 ABC transporter permease [Streptomyces sp. FR-008]
MSDTQPGKQPGQSPAAADQAPAEAEGTTKTTVPAPAGPVDASAPAADALTPVDPRLLVREQGFAGYLTDFKRRIKGGELGSIPVLVGLVVIWAIFETTTGRFLDPSNLTNIAQYIVGPGLIATGIVFVLLLGEIDLSVGSVAGLTAALTSVLAVKQDLNEGLAVLLGLLAAGAIGALHGFFFARIGVPAFVVTLAGFLGWSGLQLYVMGNTLSINNISGGVVQGLNNTYFSDIAAAYGLALVAVAAHLGSQLLDRKRRRAVDLPHRPLSEVLLRSGVVAVLAFATAWMLNQESGLPLGLTVFVGVVVLAAFVLKRTSYGRQVFAVGGGVEAARRAGINVVWVRISVFTISGFLGGLGGLFIASQAGVADSNLGGGDTLMLAIAAAVIGGTSLFGGRGTPWSALIGILVIQSIMTGLYMSGSSSDAVQSMITGVVLLAAVVIDSVSRRTQKTAGRA